MKFEQRRAHILIVEDEPGIREILATFLKENGYSVHVSDNGKEAIEYIEKVHDIDLIISDLLMPVMGGNEMAKHIRSLNINVNIIGITGSNWDFDAELFDTMLEKPFHLEALADAVSRFLGK